MPVNKFAILYESDNDDDCECVPVVSNVITQSKRVNISIFEKLQKENEMDKEIMDKVSKFTKEKMIENGLNKWTVGFDRNEFDCASTRYYKRKIVFSRLYLRENIDNWHHIEMTIYHELAHALLPIQGHTKKWKELCLKIGGDGIIGYD
jgi:hypothetical protein